MRRPSGRTTDRATVKRRGPLAKRSQRAGSTEPRERTPRSRGLAAAARESESLPVSIVRELPSWIWGALLIAVVVGLGLGLFALRENRHRRRAEREVLVDPLTGIAGRLGLDLRLALEWARAVRYDRPLGVLVLDLDGFKQINDSRGHAAGDELLRQTAAAIAGRIRRSDVPARLGGDEFVVLTTETHEEGLAALAASLREAVVALSLQISIGWAERTPADESASEVLHRADLAMYQAKQRDRPQLPIIRPSANGARVQRSRAPHVRRRRLVHLNRGLAFQVGLLFAALAWLTATAGRTRH